MRILTYIPVWKRREITQVCYESLLRTYVNAPRHLSFQTVIVASNDQDAQLAEQYGFDVFRYENKPLGRKFNAGLEYALGAHNWDYLFQLNSDNVLSTEFWKLMYQYIEMKMFFFGVDRVYFYDSATRDMRRFQYSFGCGIRFIRRDVVELAGYGDSIVFEMWTPDKNASLDNDSSNIILERAHHMQYIARNKAHLSPVVVDIKSDVNIHPFSEFRLAKRLNESERLQVMRRFPELKVFDERMVKVK